MGTENVTGAHGAVEKALHRDGALARESVFTVSCASPCPSNSRMRSPSPPSVLRPEHITPRWGNRTELTEYLYLPIIFPLCDD